VSRFGDVPGTGGFSTDHFGIFTRTVKDSALVLAAIAGKDPKDPLSSSEPLPNYLSAIGNSIKGLRVGVLRGYADDNVSRDVRRAFETSTEFLKSLGMQKTEITIPHSNLIAPVQMVTSRVENVSNLNEYIRTRSQDFSRSLLLRHIGSLLIPGSIYVVAQRVRRIICDEFSKAFEDLDVIVTPTTPLAAPKIEECKTGYVEVDGRRVPYQNPAVSFCTVLTIPFNLTGLPALSVCCGYSSSGLPIGLQIVAPAFREATLLQVAHAYEQAAGWYRTRPVIKQD